MTQRNRRYSDRRNLRTLIACSIMAVGNKIVGNGYDRIKRDKAFSAPVKDRDELLDKMVSIIGESFFVRSHAENSVINTYLQLSKYIDNIIEFAKKYNLKKNTGYTVNSLLDMLTEEFLILEAAHIQIDIIKRKPVILYNGPKEGFYELLETFIKSEI